MMPLIALLLLLNIPSGSVRAETRQQFPEAGKSAYSFGVFPFLPAARLENVFAPVARELGRALGRQVLYRSAATYEQFASQLARQEFDIAHIQPFDYIRIAAKNGYQPVARRNDILATVAVVRDDGLIQGIGDLRGTTIAMAPEIAATTYIGNAMLGQAGIDRRMEAKIIYLEGHHSCIHHMIIGYAAACFTSIQSARLYEKETGIKLRTIAQSASIPQTLFVVHTRVSPKDLETIKTTLLTTTLQGLEPNLREFISRDAQRPFIASTDADYDAVRQYLKQLEGKR